MALDVIATIEIGGPPEAVAAYEFDPENDPSWIGGVKTAARLTDGPITVGSRVRRLGSFLRRPIEWVMDVVELVPARRLAMHAVRSPFPMDVTYELEPNGRGTTARIRIREARGMYRLMGPFTPWMVRRSVQSDLGRLKRAVEKR
jgi:polyketide cyclase/dehydrase/lipid transport protein